MKKKGTFWIFISVSIISFSLVVLYPLISGIYLSFTDWNGIGDGAKLVGFSNYAEILNRKKDPEFLVSFLFTLKFAAVSILTINLVGFSLALLVTRGLKGTNILRTIFFMPNLIGGLILGFIWNFIFIEVFTAIGKSFNIHWLTGWLSDANTGFFGLVILMTWQMSGYIMLIYIAALQNIPEELIEAAQIDGANAWQRVKNIVFPLVRPAFTVSLFLTISNAFKLFDQNLSLTAGGPGNATQMLAMNIYKTAFTYNKLGSAQAKAVIFFILVASVTLTQVYFSKKKEVEM
jgi:raffinose/stachyose/melibiose transport system permease protein